LNALTDESSPRSHGHANTSMFADAMSSQIPIWLCGRQKGRKSKLGYHITRAMWKKYFMKPCIQNIIQVVLKELLRIPITSSEVAIPR
jgi:hypothetical protein